MGSSRGTSTSTATPTIDPVFMPLAQQAVQQANQGLATIPLPLYLSPMPLQIAPESQYTQMAYNQLPGMQSPLPYTGMVNTELLPQLGQINQQFNSPFKSNPYL